MPNHFASNKSSPGKIKGQINRPSGYISRTRLTDGRGFSAIIPASSGGGRNGRGGGDDDGR
ncbi:MAG: hypothetical protein ACYSUC_11890, partial [Planctomycetota bacterium]